MIHLQNTVPWGQHLILDMNGCNQELLANKQNIIQWTQELIKAIDMVAYGEPVIEHFATHSHEAAGYTMVQLIETSAISAHFAENIGQVYIDIFSCKSFDNKIAREICEKYFEPALINQNVLMRGMFEKTQSITSETGESHVQVA